MAQQIRVGGQVPKKYSNNWFQVSRPDVERWNNWEKASYPYDALSWFGKKNMVLKDPGTYAPAPPLEVMQCVEKMYNQVGKKWEWKDLPPYQSYMNWLSFYKPLLGWLSSTAIPPPYGGFYQDITELSWGPAPPSLKIQNTLVHLAGWSFYLVEQVCKLNIERKKPTFQAFPANWGAIEHTMDGHYNDIFALSKQIPPLTDFSCPPDSILGILINYNKQVSKRFGGKNKDGIFLPPPKDDLQQANNVLSTGSKKIIGDYFLKTFGTIAQQASLIQTGERLPYYQWEGLFMNQIIFKMTSQIPDGQMDKIELWRENWPKRNPNSIWVMIKFNGTKEYIYPPAYWPIPSNVMVNWLTQVANLPANLTNGGEMKVEIADAINIKNCFYPAPGWLNPNFDVSAINISQIDSVTSKNALSKALTMVYAYAVTLKNWIGGRQGKEWKWDRNGELTDMSPTDRYKACLFKQKTVGYVKGKYLNQDQIFDNAECDPDRIKGWNHPWELNESDLMDYIAAVAGRPAVREPKSGEDHKVWKDSHDRSIDGYREWRHRILLNPMILKEYPVGAYMGDIQQGTKYAPKPVIAIYNLYPNYGVWIAAEGGDSWTHFMLNPYHDLFGKYLLTEMLEIGDQMMTFEIEMFNKVKKVALDTVDEVTDTVVKDLPKVGGAVSDTLSTLSGPVVLYAGLAAGLMLVYSQTIK